MSDPVFRRAHFPERARIVDFINENFDWRLPLVNRRDFFEYYYCGVHFQFVVAEQDGELLAAAGYIPASRSDNPDIWVSVWVAKKGHNGIGLELMSAIPRLLNARVVACNNIRANTCAFYRFLGWHAERLPHYYRLSGQDCYHLAQPTETSLLPVNGDLTLDKVSSVTRLQGLGLPASTHTPCKDLWYLARRYFAFPHLAYDVWSMSRAGVLLAYLVTRTVASGDRGEIPILRIVDFVGEDAVLPHVGRAIDSLLHTVGAEYADCYNAGIPAEIWAQTGFRQRLPGDGVIIPNYLTPPLYENTEYYYFTNQPEHFVLFKADGDQDRPNLPADED